MGDRDGSANSGCANSGNSRALIGGLAGALLGAAGLAWWLLSEAEARSQDARQQRHLRLSRLQESSSLDELPVPRGGRTIKEQDLHHKVQELNSAIEEVRRQLEGMATSR